MSKKVLSIAIALIMAAGLVFIPDGETVFTAGALDDGVWTFTQNADGETATVTKYTGGANTVAIPSTVYNSESDETLTVTVVGDDDSVFGNTVTSVTIDDSVTSIGHNAFYNCSSLTSVTIVTEAKMSLY